MKKRGISSVISNVLIILAVVVAAGIVWLMVSNWKIDSLAEEKQKQIELKGANFEISNFVMQENKNISFFLKRTIGGGNISGFYILLKDSNEQTALVKKFSSTPLKKGEKIFIVISPSELDLQLNNQIKEISIYPITISKTGKEIISNSPKTIPKKRFGGSSGSSSSGNSNGNENPPQPTPDPKAFPEAEGFGAYTKGGREGKIIYVNTTDDYYPNYGSKIPGSLRWAVENQTEPRTILFNVGGTIHLKESILFDGKQGSYITIAGQTAPGGGILITGGDLQIINGAHDIIIRHIRTKQSLNYNLTLISPVKPYDSPFLLYKGILVLSNETAYSYNLIFDHCSFEWGMDDMLGLGGRNITVQWNIIGEGSKYGDNIPENSFLGNLSWKRNGQPSQGLVFGEYNSLCQTNDCPGASIHHNLFIHNSARNPMVYTNGSRIDIINNLVYNYGFAILVSMESKQTETTKANIIGNKFIHGPDWPPSNEKAISLHEGINTTFSDGSPYYQPDPSFNTIYVKDNIDDASRKNDSIDDWNITAWVHWPGYPDIDCPCEECYRYLAENGKLYCTYFTIPLPEEYRKVTPFQEYGVPVAIHNVSDLESILSSAVGATKPKRDSTDERLISELTARTGHYSIGENQISPLWDENGILITSGHDPIPELSSDIPQTDTDSDGMSDNWEIANDFNPNNFADGNQDRNNDGYTNVEEYLNSID